MFITDFDLTKANQEIWSFRGILPNKKNPKNQFAQNFSTGTKPDIQLIKKIYIISRTAPFESKQLEILQSL